MSEYDRIIAIPEASRTPDEALFLEYHKHIEDIKLGRVTVEAGLLSARLQVRFYHQVARFTTVMRDELITHIDTP